MGGDGVKGGDWLVRGKGGTGRESRAISAWRTIRARRFSGQGREETGKGGGGGRGKKKKNGGKDSVRSGSREVASQGSGGIHKKKDNLVV